jgi:phosphatidylserine decarboxylase
MTITGKKSRTWLNWFILVIGMAALLSVVWLLWYAHVTQHLYTALVKDPPRTPPPGQVIVSPADGRVLYVRRISNGMIPMVVKEGVAVPVANHIKSSVTGEPFNGYLIGIYMGTYDVHINRAPLSGTIEQQIVFNGPHMNMTRAETTIIVTNLIPGLTTLRKLLGMEPYNLADKADFIRKSARETLELRDRRGKRIYIVRIADYYVGKILTWVGVHQQVATGERIGMITWGSQTDLLIEDSPGLDIKVSSGSQIKAGETIVATY